MDDGNNLEQKTACQILGCPDGMVDGASILSSGSKFAEWFVSLIFVGLAILGVFVIIRAVVNIIRSEGSDTQLLENSKKAIKGVLYGIVIFFVGVIGYVLVLNFLKVPTQIEIEKPEAIKNIDIPFI
ncbi:hypothetical protein D6810_01535 [Candidatus Dojkabacteria bacterium]|uniref:Uncharacterized protein n=1 Tax=Candidatus Dojkabacteria bacterium TaxID=2099670 RepID=A0A3M0YYS3_9BACT|nr:MAG: hypothetical protein D6810_01535 [Candidatus Dojkabacteria bacterium]